MYGHMFCTANPFCALLHQLAASTFWCQQIGVRRKRVGASKGHIRGIFGGAGVSPRVGKGRTNWERGTGSWSKLLPARSTSSLPLSSPSHPKIPLPSHSLPTNAITYQSWCSPGATLVGVQSFSAVTATGPAAVQFLLCHWAFYDILSGDKLS